MVCVFWTAFSTNFSMKLIYQLHTSPEVVFPYLSDMDLFTSVHPVISKMVSTGKDEYTAFETLQIGPVPFSFSYPTVVHHNSTKGSIHMQAIIFKMTTMALSFTLSAQNGTTTIEEEIQVKSIWPLKSLILNTVKTQHTILFKNIEEHIRQQS